MRGPGYATAVLALIALAAFAPAPAGAAEGDLTFLQSFTDGAGGVDGLLGANAVTVSPDGENVYVAGRFDHSIAVFARNPVSGVLTFQEVEKDGVAGVDGLARRPAGDRLRRTARTSTSPGSEDDADRRLRPQPGGRDPDAPRRRAGLDRSDRPRARPRHGTRAVTRTGSGSTWRPRTTTRSTSSRATRPPGTPRLRRQGDEQRSRASAGLAGRGRGRALAGPRSGAPLCHQLRGRLADRLVTQPRHGRPDVHRGEDRRRRGSRRARRRGRARDQCGRPLHVRERRHGGHDRDVRA